MNKTLKKKKNTNLSQNYLKLHYPQDYKQYFNDLKILKPITKIISYFSLYF